MVANVPKRTLNTLMNAISSGVVPRRGLEYIAVGRKKETQTFVNDLDDTADGGGAFRFISGRFGNGKSFMTQMVRNYAMDKGFVVMDADLAINRRITGSKGEGVNTYRELVKNTAYRTRPEGGAVEPILQEWAESLCDELGGRDAVTLDGVRHIVRQKTADMASMQYYRDFATVLSQYVYSYLTDQEDDPAIRWLKGEYDLKSNVRKDLGVSTLVDDSDWYEIIKLWTRLFVTLGYKGMVVFLDEAVVLYKLQNKVSRSNNYERLLTMFNDIMQGKSSYLSMYVCGTPEFIQDPNRGLYSYEALKSRLVSGRYETGYDNYLGPVINLRPLSNEEIFVLLRTVKGLHEQRYGYTSDIDDRKLEIYLKTVLSGSVSSSMLTPREITRDLISLLDTLHQNPQATFEQLVQGRKVANDRNPDDDIIEDLDV
ncbi:MAG: ATP-binding protein [Candidatus Methanomethylophilus sp.]|nr:ATP-binding protein [Methanomethylophilus sp.]MBQ4368210.1 ATP-binding protein [Methanomethylophilus sp.]MBQ5397329.1 ATP-binding protein [Methanomethylophilus sp.]MBQ5447905.1 ATP-binding protein [Methanomethylophilus sp.]